MDIPSKEDIILMDRFLNLRYKHSMPEVIKQLPNFELIDKAKLLISEFNSTEKEIVAINSGFIKPNRHTREFIESGGFKEYFSNKVLKDLSIENAKLQNERLKSKEPETQKVKLSGNNNIIQLGIQSSNLEANQSNSSDTQNKSWNTKDIIFLFLTILGIALTLWFSM